MYDVCILSGWLDWAISIKFKLGSPQYLQICTALTLLFIFSFLSLCFGKYPPHLTMKHHKYILVTLSLGISSLALPIALADPSPSLNSDSSMYSIQTSPPTPTNVCTKACLQPSATPSCPSQCPGSCIFQQSTDPCCPNSMEAVCNDSSGTQSSSSTKSSPPAVSSSLASPAVVSPTASSPQSSVTAHNNAASGDMTSHHGLYISTALVAVVFAALLH